MADLYILNGSVASNVGLTAILFASVGATLISKSTIKKWYQNFTNYCEEKQIVNWAFGVLITVIAGLFIIFLASFIELYETPKLPYDTSQILKAGFVKLRSDVIRNHGWILWGIAFAGFSLSGIWIAYEGRKTQKKQWDTQHTSHLRERFEKCVSMLGESVTASRVGGCHALKDLAIQNEKMKIECLTVLFSFIEEPYVDEKYRHKSLERIFPINESLRNDIREAASSITAIYKYYQMKYNDSNFKFKYEKKIAFSSYFSKNKTKDPITIIAGNFKDLKLENAHFEDANFTRGKFNNSSLIDSNLAGVNLTNARIANNTCLKGSDLTNSTIEGAAIKEVDMNFVNLTGALISNTEIYNVQLNDGILRNTDFFNCKLDRVSMSRADIRSANFIDIIIKTIILNNADISSANMEMVVGLTKENILSAKWGKDAEGWDEPPNLPDALQENLEIQDWIYKDTG